MYVPPLRPRFELDLGCEIEAALGRLRRGLEVPGAPVKGWVEPPYAELSLPADQRHFWSPRLAIAAEARGAGVVLHCRFGPSPAVWTGFLAAYAATGLVGLGGAFVAAAQLTLAVSPWGSWLLGGAALCGLGLYLGAIAGQRAGEAQMRILRRQLDLMIFECTIY